MYESHEEKCVLLLSWWCCSQIIQFSWHTTNVRLPTTATTTAALNSFTFVFPFTTVDTVMLAKQKNDKWTIGRSLTLVFRPIVHFQCNMYKQCSYTLHKAKGIYYRQITTWTVCPHAPTKMHDSGTEWERKIYTMKTYSNRMNNKSKRYSLLFLNLSLSHSWHTEISLYMCMNFCCGCIREDNE